MSNPVISTVELCPEWCAEGDRNSDGLNLAGEHHPERHLAMSTTAGRDDDGRELVVYIEQPRGRRSAPGVTVAADLADALVTTSPATARSLAAHLVHAADVAEGLRR